MAALWNRDRLYRLAQEKLRDYLLVVVSNREPYVHMLSGDKLSWQRPVSGLTEALDPVMRASGGVWIAQGSGDADRRAVDRHDRVAVPPDKPSYTLRRVWLTGAENAGFYLGFANQGLWPLCHLTPVQPVFKLDDWQAYKKVNRIFADTIMQEVGQKRAVVFVQDYHFALLARYLKDRDPGLVVGQFWHIPWPPAAALRACPWYQEIIDGLLGNDLLGFHTRSFCRNFREAAGRGRTQVEPFPIGVDFAAISQRAATDTVAQEVIRLRRRYGLEGKIVGAGMDRIDYTKGIPERLRALDRFLEESPEYRGRVVFIQAGMPSRTDIETYKDLGRQTDRLVNEINAKYGAGSYRPVISLNRQLAPDEMNALRRLSDFCVVSPLHDGMNLVAKEYVAARVDGDGVLVLSRFAGAAAELTDAVLIDPADTETFARRIKEAIEMPEEERRRRMKQLRAIVARNNIYRWGASILARLVEVAQA